MLIIEDIQQLRKVHLLIKKRRTGSPEEFASVLCVSRRKMYYLLDYIRDLGAEIVYNRKDCTFYYPKEFDLDISVKIKKKGNEEWQEISGGFSFSDEYLKLHASYLHGRRFLELLLA